MRKLAAFIFIVPLCLVTLAFSQSTTITGTVTSASDNSPLPGATVLVKGTVLGTVTDVDGKYVLSVPAGNDVLVFSFVGYKDHEETIGGRSVINVAMEPDVFQLNNVVVTAIGIKAEKKALNYSAQEVGSDEIVSGRNTNMIDNLNGKIAGLDVTSSTGTPGASAYMTIRGQRSIIGDNQPLIVVDGVPYDNTQYNSGNFNDGFGGGGGQNNNLLEGVAYSNRGIDLNPNDIQSITVLKGAAASALYGSRAANGVIVITTKKGGGGANGGKMNVSLSSTLTYDVVNKLPDMQNTYAQGSGGDYLPPETGASGSWGPPISTLSWDGATDYPFDMHGHIVDNSDPSAQTPVTPYNNEDLFFQTGKTFDNTLSLSGGDQNSGYYFSIGYLKQDGVIPLSDFSRYSAKLSGNTNLGTKWKTTGSITYTKSGGSRVQQGSNVSGLMLGLLRTPPTFDNSNGVSDPSDPASYLLPDGSQRNYRGGGGYDNPYWTINQNPFNDDVNRMFGYGELDYNATDWLDFTYRLGADFYSDRRKQIFAINSRAFPSGQVDEDQIFFRQINSDLLINLHHDLGTTGIKGNLTLGNNMNSQYYQQVHTQGDGLVIPDFYNLSNATAVLGQEYHSIVRTLGNFADLELSYKDMIFLGLTGRADKSSTFSSGKKAFFYPSANLGIVVTDLLGVSDNKVLPYAKLRVAYAEVGTQPGPYLTATTFDAGFYGDGYVNGNSFPYLGLGGFQEGDNLGNPDLEPENTKSFETGADLRFIKNRIGLDFTYYDAKSTGQIIPVPIAASSGYLTETLNAAEVENSGVEISLNVTPVKTQNLNWDFTINFTKNTSMVNKLAPGVDFIGLGGFEGSLIGVEAGQPYGIIYGTRWLHDAQGNVVIADQAALDDALAGGVNAAYVYDVGYPMYDVTEGVIGDPNPDYIASIVNELSWKGFGLLFQFDTKQGFDIWDGTLGALDYFGTSAYSADHRDKNVTFEGVMGHLDDNLNVITDGNNSTPVLYNQDWVQGGFGSGFTGPTELYVEDGSFIRLRELTVYYMFPSKWLDKVSISSLELGFTARNLWLSTDYQGVDPETSLTGANSAQGIDYFNMPNTKSYGLNLKLTL